MKILLFAFSLFFLPAPHPLHLSVTNILFDKNEKTLTIYIKIFNDDLLNAIITKNPKVNCTKDDLYKEVKLVTNYLNENFIIELDKKKISLADFRFIEGKNTENAVLYQYSLKNIKPGKKIKIKNQILFTLYPDQKNMVIFKSNDNEKGCISEKSQSECEIML